MEFNRSTLYYSPKGESAENLDIMEEMDKYYINHPTAGVLTMVNMLVLKGISANPKRIRRLMRKMNLQTIYHRNAYPRAVGLSSFILISCVA